MSQFVSIYITTSNEETATQLAQKLVVENLVACTNIIPTIKSIYKWKGDLQINGEAVILCKTTKAMEQLVIKRVCELHVYDMPCVVSTDIADGNGDFLNWIDQSVSQKGGQQ